MRIVSTDGVAVAAHDLGGPADAAAPVLLLCHANGFHARVWAPLAKHLTGTHRSIAVDLRGHGDSETPAGLGFDWAGFGDDVEAVLDSAAIPEGAAVHGVGHSLGGAALVLAAARRPAAFRSLWLYEPIVPPPEGFGPESSPESPNPMAAAAERRREVFESHAAAVANFGSKPPLDALHPDALREYVEGGFAVQPDGSVRIKCRAAWEASIYRSVVTNRAWDALPGVAVPAVVAVGADQPAGPAAFAPAVAERLPGGRLVRFGDLGHFGPLEDPAQVAAAIGAFVGSPSAGPVPLASGD